MQNEEKIVITIKCCVRARDKGIHDFTVEYNNFKEVLTSKVQKAIRPIVKDPEIKVYAQQKWMLDKRLTKYIKNLPFHPMPFHNQSVWIEKREKNHFRIYFKNKQLPRGRDITLNLVVPKKYRSLLAKACGENNPVLGQVEVIEDNQYARFNIHITLRLPKPQLYIPKGWVGVDVGFRYLAVSAFVQRCVTSQLTSSKLRGVTDSPYLQAYSSKRSTQESIAQEFTHDTNTSKRFKVCDVTFHGKGFKTRIIQLKYLLKQYQRSGRSWKKWNYRLKYVTKYAVGVIAKEIVAKAEKHQAGIAFENLSFPSHTKRFLIPRYKLKCAIENLCKRKGIPFSLVNPRNTSIICNKCGYKSKTSRNGKIFRCVECGYEVNSDLNAAINIANRAILA